MTREEEIKQRKAFNKWKKRTLGKLYPLVAKFFSHPITDTNQARMVGRIVEQLNNPYYEFSTKLEPLADTDIIAKRIMIQIEVEDFYKLMKKKFGSIK